MSWPNAESRAAVAEEPPFLKSLACFIAVTRVVVSCAVVLFLVVASVVADR